MPINPDASIIKQSMDVSPQPPLRTQWTPALNTYKATLIVNITTLAFERISKLEGEDMLATGYNKALQDVIELINSQ